jgi:Domain of unknown function (DUF3576)
MIRFNKIAGGKLALLLTSAALAMSLSACGIMGKKADASAYSTPEETSGTPISKLFGFGGEPKAAKNAPQAGIGVNAYLWRASLDTLSFMPLASADPWGGVIITEWYASPEKPDERFKATIYILDTRLRADGLNVNLNKQVQLNGQWVDAEVSAQTSIDVENAILSRARSLRFSDVK